MTLHSLDVALDRSFDWFHTESGRMRRLEVCAPRRHGGRAMSGRALGAGNGPRNVLNVLNNTEYGTYMDLYGTNMVRLYYHV